MTNKEKAKALWDLVMDRTRSNAEHRAALDDLVALKKAAKTSLDKLGVPQVMWDREDVTNRENAELLGDMDPLDEHVATTSATADPLKADPLAAVDPLDEKPEPLRRPSGEPVRDTKGEVSLIKPHHLEAAKRGKPKAAAPKQRTAVPTEERGLISAMVRCELMDTSDSYALIVERVKARYPNAQTTARSVASVAADLRKDGVEVASRRPAKAA